MRGVYYIAFRLPSPGGSIAKHQAERYDKEKRDTRDREVKKRRAKGFSPQTYMIRGGAPASGRHGHATASSFFFLFSFFSSCTHVAWTRRKEK